MAAHELYDLLGQFQFSLDDEIVLQGEIAEVLDSHKVEYTREYKLSSRDRIDFLVGNVGIEVKIKGAASAIYRQCARYCTYVEVTELLLVTNRSMGFPEQIEGKNCYMLSLGRAWML